MRTKQPASLIALLVLSGTLSAQPPVAPHSGGTAGVTATPRAPGTASRIDPEADREDGEPVGSLLPKPEVIAKERASLHRLERKDIESYFAHGDLSRAKAELDRGRPAAAKKLLESLPPNRPTRYLRAQTLLRMKLYQDAALELAALADDWENLRNHLLFQAANAYEKAGLRDQAETSYAAIPATALEHSEAQLGYARMLTSRGDWSCAGEALVPLVDVGSTASNSVEAAAWATLATVARAAGDLQSVERAEYSLWALHPNHSQAQQIHKRLGRTNVPLEWTVLRAETLISMHANLTAWKLLEDALPELQLPEAIACRANFAYGLVLRKERKHSRAIQVLRPVVDQCPDPELRPRALYVLGYSESVSDPTASIGTYQKLVKDYPAHAYADDALFFAAEQELWRGAEGASIALLNRISKEYPTSTFVGDAIFKKFWIARTEGLLEEGLFALNQLEALKGTGVPMDQVLRARYWRSRTLELLGKKQEATRVLESVVADGASSYYGLLARSRLATLGRALPAGLMESVEVWPMEAGPLWEDAHFRAGLELAKLESSAAASELMATGWRKMPESGLRVLVQVLDESGFPNQATSLARVYVRESSGSAPQAETRRLYEVAYPHAFRALVEKHSKAARVDPDLMQALIREESAFNPRARSSTGAIGLAQLMPSTARQVARKLRGPRYTDRSLLDPKQNIRLGSAYLGHLHRGFEGNFAYAVAGYNAGPAAVRRWLKRNPTADLDAWVEEIPVEETRNYVKRVLGSYGTYELLYDPGVVPSGFAQLGQRTGLGGRP